MKQAMVKIPFFCLWIVLSQACSHGQPSPSSVMPRAAGPEGASTSQNEAAPSSVASTEGEPWSLSVEELRAMANESERVKDADLEYLLREDYIRFDENGRRTLRRHRIERYLTEQAIENFGSFRSAYSPWYQAAPTLHLRVITPRGQVLSLDPKTISDSSVGEEDPNLYSDRHLIQAPIPGLEAGSIIESIYEVQETEPMFSAGILTESYLASPWPIHRMSITIDAPENLPLQYKVRGWDISPREKKRDGRVILSIASDELIEAVEPPSYARHGTVLYPSLVVSTGASWQEVASSYSKIVDDQIAEADLQSILLEAVGDATEPREVAKRILARVHQIARYTGVEFREAAIVPRKPETVLSRGYGDCKDKSALTVALLRAAGLDAHVALLSAGFDADVVENLPGMGQFNHAIVFVDGEDPFWIDPTVELLPAGELPLSDQGRLSLIARPSTTELERIPEAPSKVNVHRELYEVRLASYDRGAVSLSYSGEGAFALTLRRQLMDISDKDLNELGQAYARSISDDAKMLSVKAEYAKDLEHLPMLRIETDNVPWAISEEFNGAVYLAPGGRVFNTLPDFLGIDPEKLTDKENVLKPSRKEDVQIYFPQVFDLTYHIVPPAGMRPLQLPEDRHHEVASLSYDEKYRSLEDNSVEARITLDTGKGWCTVEEARALRDYVLETQKRNVVGIQFQHPAVKDMTDGRAREGLDLLRAEVAAAPDSVIARVRLANGLLKYGFSEAAAEEARVAVKSDPKSALARYTLGLMLEHNPAGVYRGNGYFRKEALQAMRKAVELDSEDATYRAELAILLEYDKHGNRYVDAGGMEEAIKEYRSLEKDLSNEDYRPNLLMTLFQAGHYEEALELAERSPETDLRNQVVLACLAILQGPEAMFERLSKMSSSQESSGKFLGTAAELLTNAGRYSEALAIFKNLARLGAQVSEQVRLFTKLEKAEYKTLTPEDPRWPVAEFLEMFFGDEKVSTRDMKSFMSESFVRLLEKEATDQEVDVSSMIQSMGLGAQKKLIQELLLASLEVREQGSSGAWVTIAVQNESINSMSCFVTREKKGYRLASLPKLWRFGEEAFERLKKSDLEGSSQWLNWAVAIFTPSSNASPLASHPVLELWHPEQEADESTARVASAALASTGLIHNETIPILQQALEKSPEAPQRTAIKRALVGALTTADRKHEALELSGQLRDAFPRSEEMLRLHTSLLKEEGQLEEAIQLSKSFLEQNPSNSRVAVGLAQLMVDAKQENEAFELLRKQSQYGQPNSSVYNLIGWLGLFEDKVEPEVIEAAEKANELTKFTNPSLLNTLACVYAATGRIDEARQYFLKTVDAKQMSRAESADWWVMGRIAEQLNLKEVARQMYEKVEKPKKEDEPLSPYEIAQRRLALLDEEGAPAP